MRTVSRTRRSTWSCALALLMVAAVPHVVQAHHGWSWAVDEQSTLQATIESISMAPPHPQLRVKDNDGQQWQIDLGNPSQTERSGFRADSAKPGDTITILGNRNKDAAQRHMKAVRITIDGKNFDLYPERLPGA